MFVAVKKMPLVDAVLLSNSAPLFIPLVTWAWLRQRIQGMVWVSLLIGFAGVVVILRPSLALLKNPAAPIALSAALFSAFALVSVNQLSKSEPARRILFYYFLFSSLAAAPFAILRMACSHGTGMALPRRHRFDDGRQPDADHPGVSARFAEPDRAVQLHRSDLFRIDRLGRLAQYARLAILGGRSAGDRGRSLEHQSQRSELSGSFRLGRLLESYFG